MPYTIRTMKQDEVSIAIDLAKQEGWNPGEHDAECFYATDPEGFFIGELYEEPVATISAIKYGTSFGFIGYYIVKPNYRGKGYGIAIWEEAIKRLKGRNIALDGVTTQQDNYKKSGFKLAYSNIRFEGKTRLATEPDIQCLNISTILFEDLKDYDSHFFPDSREHFLKSWINQPDSVALTALNGEGLSGYGVIRKCHIGYKIGPLFADTPLIADSLFTSLISAVKSDEPVYLDIPEVNCEAQKLVKRHKMNKVFETARMYTSKPPDISIARTYGVTTFELG